jgi:hypothetical protein
MKRPPLTRGARTSAAPALASHILR